MPPTRTPHLVARALSGAAAMVLAMGVGRFAYTALLPSLQRGLRFDDASAGAIASANLAGYLAGVFWARGAARYRSALLAVGLAACVVTTALVALTTGVVGWGAIRFLSGVGSGLVFVLVSSAVLEALPPGKEFLSGVLYSGVGVGMALSGAVAVFAGHRSWSLPWLLLAALSAALAVPAVPLLRAALPVRSPAPPALREDQVSLSRLGAAYFLEGLGYIVSGTFVVAAVQRTPGLEGLAPWVWVATGLAAAPSAVLWGMAARRLGAREALLAAFVGQALGMALPALSPSAWAAMIGALLFGGTFMGIVTLTMSLGRRLRPGQEARVIGSLTLVFGVGQILGPLLAGLLSRATGGPRVAVLAATGAVGLGAALLARPSSEPGAARAGLAPPA